MSPALVMCDHQRVNILSCRRSTFCLPERVGSKGLSGVKVWVTFAKGPSSPSANRSWKAAVKPGAAAKAGLALIPCPWRTDFIYSGQVHKKAPSHYLLSLKKTNQEPPDKDQAPLSHMLDLFPRVNPPSQLTKSQLSKLESDSGMRPWKAGSDPHSSVCSEERLCTQVIWTALLGCNKHFPLCPPVMRGLRRGGDGCNPSKVSLYKHPPSLHQPTFFYNPTTNWAQM